MQTFHGFRNNRCGIGKAAIVGLLVLIMIIAVLAYIALAPRAPVHDVAIASVVPASMAVPLGLNIKINVTVKNQGSYQESFNVSITLPQNSSVQTFTQNVASLSAGAEKKVTFNWNTQNLSVGDYRINMTASQVVNETDVADNGLSTTLSLSNKVMLRTTMGNITIELFQDMPITSKNFKNLTWIRIYDGTIFHRVIRDFMIQGGDPTGTGYGDPKIALIPDEFTDHNRNDRGTIAMANSGPNTGSSQFFINLVNNNYLDTLHPVFGRVIAGMNVVDAIGNVPTYTEPESQKDKPKQDATIIRAEFVK